MTRSLSVLLAAFALMACQGDTHLRAQGFVRSTVVGSAVSGFEFEQPVRLDGSAGLVTGGCELRPTADGHYSILVDLYGPEQPAGSALRSASFMLRTGTTSASVEARLGLDDYSNTACGMDVTYADERGAVAFETTGPCTLTNGSSTSQLEVDLEFSNCTVIR